MNWKEHHYKINGYDVTARYCEENIEHIFKPLIKHLQELQNKKKERIFVFLAAPPACGKTTLVTYLCELGKEMGFDNMQQVGMDGFHYPNEYLDFHFIKGTLLREVKGCPESFDLPKLTSYIQDTKTKDMDWPVYDRNIHNPKEHAQHIQAQIVLIEGNYLLMEEEGWKDLRIYCDYAIFIHAQESVLAKRLIDRKAKSTNTREEAIAFYHKSDQKNIQRVLANTMNADLKLLLHDDGIYQVE